MHRFLILCAAALVMGLVGAGTASASSHNCVDYGYSFQIDPNNDPNNLDADGDGVACEDYAPLATNGGDGGATTMPATGVGPIAAGTSGPFALLALMAVSALAGAVRLRLRA